MVQYLWYLQMSFAPIPILVHQQSPVVKSDFLFSVNVPDVFVEQRSVSESTALHFDYLKAHLIAAAVILQERSVCGVGWSQEEMQQCMTMMSDLITGKHLHRYHSFLFICSCWAMFSLIM